MAVCSAELKILSVYINNAILDINFTYTNCLSDHFISS